MDQKKKYTKQKFPNSNTPNMVWNSPKNTPEPLFNVRKTNNQFYNQILEFERPYKTSTRTAISLVGLPHQVQISTDTQSPCGLEILQTILQTLQGILIQGFYGPNPTITKRARRSGTQQTPNDIVVAQQNPVCGLAKVETLHDDLVFRSRPVTGLICLSTLGIYALIPS